MCFSGPPLAGEGARNEREGFLWRGSLCGGLESIHTMSKGKKIALWSVLSVVFVLAVGAGWMFRTYGKMITAKGGHVSFFDVAHDAHEAIFTPKDGFPGEDKLTIVCMGIDDNWTNGDVVYTSQSRTDTLFVLTLDLNTQKATMLSIPRDTYAHIVGTQNDWHFKINAAYTTGGPDPDTVATVNRFLGINAQITTWS